MDNYAIETDLSKQNYQYICGIDEVGRGAIFGPVVAGAVILTPGSWPLCAQKGITDSKKLTPKKRRELSEYIYMNATAFSIGWCWNDEIDHSNILVATKKAMKMAAQGLQISPDYVLMDGMKPDFLNINANGIGIIKGDIKSVTIAAASIIAKVFRDNLISALSIYFPAYQVDTNKGYPTQSHVQALSTWGPTTFHRKSFRIKKWQKNALPC